MIYFFYIGGGASYLRNVKSWSKLPRISIRFFLSWLTHKRRPIAPSADKLPALRLKPRLGKILTVDNGNYTNNRSDDNLQRA